MRGTFALTCVALRPCISNVTDWRFSSSDGVRGTGAGEGGGGVEPLSRPLDIKKVHQE